ncbi:protein refolding chaperone Spy/CpxP family [Rhodoblastus acidophilus]|uniref:Protein refolding chaperone Spy/CpxP family n=1 Tax=Rhodoblastus acidophilus TaxID=1074 RepID=A0A212S6Y4_RHOAC|nr:Spy/CpxP family protein refolding chaperone [Rhodoblastus acidophilus]SNB81028.1 protein refolding chaperone Spy/CpxP family [Rhodoblastus acidophilus]
MTIETQTPQPPRRWGRTVLAAALLLGLGGAGGFALGAYKTSSFFWHAMAPDKLTPEETASMVERKVDHVLSRVDATDEQKAKVNAIARAAVADLSKLGFTPRESRTKFLNLFRADQIDPDAIEALRAEQSTKWDAATKRIAQAVAEAGQVLTPEQRRDLTERWNRRVSS